MNPPSTEIVLVRDGKNPIYAITGDIDPNAQMVFKRLVGDRMGGTVELKSLGGDLVASVSIGRIVRDHGIKTVVPAGTYCLSGCAIIWAGGVERRVEEHGTVGFHRPWRRNENGEVVPGRTGIVRHYYHEIGFNEEVIEKLMADPDTFYYLTGRKAQSLGIEAHFED